MSLRNVVAGIAAAAGIIALLGGAVCTVVRSVPTTAVPVYSDNWAIAASFSDYGAVAYAGALLAVGTATVLRPRWSLVVVAVLALVLVAVHLSWLVPRFTADPRPPADADSVRLLALNMKFGGADAVEVVEQARNADVVVLTEIDAGAHLRLVAAGLTQRFPYERVGTLPNGGTAGTTVLSRFALTETRPLATDIAHQNWQVRVEVPGMGPVSVVAVHPTRPNRGNVDWIEQQVLLRAELPTGGSTVVAGDFNAVGNSLPLRALATDGLRSAVDTAGAGWQPTYPANHPLLPALVDIDHILVSPQLTAVNFRRFQVRGTDHLGVEATIVAR